MDPRYERLAEVLINYSCALKPGEKVLIQATDIPHQMVRALIRAASDAGAHPLVTLKSQAIWRDLMLAGSEEQMTLMAEAEALRMSGVDAYIGLRGNPNIAEWSDIPADKMHLYEKHFWVPVHRDIRVPKTRWAILRWPSASMAQQASQATEAFEDFYFRVCTMDYELMSQAMRPLAERMEKTERVQLKAPGTDLRFSIKGIPAIPCDGKYNIPDGEVFTAPVRESVEGTIAYNTPTIYHGVTHENVRLTFSQGKIVEATSSQNEHLHSLLDTDEGARYIGEFAIGFNPHITQPMKDILFDEKIAGSIHLTPGNAYDEADNGNRSAIHWDLVLRMTPDVGGGEILFDEEVIRRDGLFVVDDLLGLNPDQLT